MTAAHDMEALLPSWAMQLFEKNSGKSNQILLVIGNKSLLSSAEMYLFERHKGIWELIRKPIDASIGRNGFALPGKKREGDGKTPSGVYPLEFTFGYLPGIKTKMDFIVSTEDDVWVDDPNSDDYNHLVKKNITKAGSFEYMRRKDDMYKYGIVVGYNRNPVVRNLGSAIFIHVRKEKDQPTAGCVAMSEADILTILDWLDQSQKPIVIMGTEEILKYMAKKND